MEQCPFCGEEKMFIYLTPQPKRFQCGTCPEEEFMGITCRDNQISTLKDLINEAGEILEVVASHEGMYYFDVAAKTKEKAQALLPRLERGNDVTS